MKTKKILFSSMIAITVVGLTFLGCKKEAAPQQEDNDTQAASDYTQADFVYSDATNIVDDGARNETGINKMYADSCPKRTLDLSDSTKKVLTFDWGTGCSDTKDGRTRKGKIIATITAGKYKDIGAKMSVTFKDYYVSGTHVEGTVSLARTEKYAQTLKVEAGKITKPDGKFIAWDATHTRKCVSGCDSLTPNSKFSITGSSTGTNINGVKFTTNITSALIVQPSCTWKIVQGVLDLTQGNKATRTLDFGNGDCDAIVTLTINGKSITVKLPDKQ